MQLIVMKKGIELGRDINLHSIFLIAYRSQCFVQIDFRGRQKSFVDPSDFLTIIRQTIDKTGSDVLPMQSHCLSKESIIAE